jgi:hypothetical protein
MVSSVRSFNGVQTSHINSPLDPSDLSFFSSFTIILKDDILRDQLRNFLEAVFPRDAAEMLVKIDLLVVKQPAIDNDKDFYDQLRGILCQEPSYFAFSKNSANTKPDLFSSYQKQADAEIAAQLMKQDRSISNLVEIGCHNSLLKQKFQVLNKTIVLQEHTPFFNFWKIGWFKPYRLVIKTLHQLTNLDDPTISFLKDHKINLVTCFVGLHQLSEEHLKSFLTSIHYILASGGSLLLKEYVTQDLQEKRLAQVMQTISQARRNLTFAENKKNLHRFSNYDEWKKRLLEVGFEEIFINLGDRSEPAVDQSCRIIKIMRFRKKLSADPKECLNYLNAQNDYRINALNSYLKMTQHHYHHQAQELADFVQDNPFYEFPYFSHIAQYWKTLANSSHLAHIEGGYSYAKILLNQTSFLNFFTGLIFTIEYSLKGSFAGLIRNYNARMTLTFKGLLLNVPIPSISGLF